MDNLSWEDDNVGQQATGNSKVAATLAVLLCICVISQAQADDPTELETITVEATPFYIPAGSFGSFYSPPPPWTPDADSIPDTDSGGMTKDEACFILETAVRPSLQCHVDDFQAAPGFPSATGTTWSGNGCGSGGLGDWFGEQILEYKYGTEFSGDLDNPLAQFTGVSFTTVCNAHDACYATVGNGKISCDNAFLSSVKSYCAGTGSASGVCTSFAYDYRAGFKNSFAQSAYEVDQEIAKCAAWGSAMKKNECDKD